VKVTSFCKSLCVPMTMSTLPSASSFRLASSPCRLEARQFDDFHRPVGKAVAEGLEMLFAEQGGRAQHGDLLAAGDRAERGAQRDLGLAEADVAADEAVHRFARLHVLDHRVDRGGLVGRFLETEAVGEGVVVVRGELEGVTRACGALGVEREQFGRRIARLHRGAALGLLPLLRAQRVQRRGIGVAARVARDDVQLRYRHVELGVAGVMEFEELHVAFAEVHVNEALIAGDAVLLMYDRVADLQLGQVAQPVVERGFALRGVAAAARRAAGVELGFGDKRNAVKNKTFVQRRNAERHAARTGQKTGKIALASGFRPYSAKRPESVSRRPAVRRAAARGRRSRR
jgi:hypothetical protein